MALVPPPPQIHGWLRWEMQEEAALPPHSWLLLASWGSERPRPRPLSFGRSFCCSGMQRMCGAGPAPAGPAGLCGCILGEGVVICRPTHRHVSELHPGQLDLLRPIPLTPARGFSIYSEQCSLLVPQKRACCLRRGGPGDLAWTTLWGSSLSLEVWWWPWAQKGPEPPAHLPFCFCSLHCLNLPLDLLLWASVSAETHSLSLCISFL